MNKVCKKLMFVFYLSVCACLLGVKFGYCENYYPSGLDELRWGMKQQEVLDILKKEDREMGGFNEIVIPTRGTFLGVGAIIRYNFGSDRLIQISIEPNKIQVGRNVENTRYSQIRMALTRIFGEPSETSANLGDRAEVDGSHSEVSAKWKYPSGKNAIEMISTGGRANSLETILWETDITLYAPGEWEHDKLKDKIITFDSTSAALE